MFLLVPSHPGSPGQKGHKPVVVVVEVGMIFKPVVKVV